MSCETINPRWCTAGADGYSTLIMNTDGSIEQYSSDEQRNFLTDIIETGQDKEIIEKLYSETGRVIMLVRERLEREKPIEAKLEQIIEGEIVG
ncbi:hypothetical protein P4T20_13775 [Aneurinibacillus thermoaerophilus]|uniref:hypothetical protein n=1 Tax=Aneurinibacillus thermoaerophilus TaxID=143495 RepID=UPI002E21A06E|nr:hypothetical protein [Aneurinibacillus thermoaerophilus]